MIIPSWESEIPDENKIILKIEPGMAFGTGHHETTSMMISALLKYFHNGASILDVGTGSGILAILAQKLGAGKIHAIDNDQATALHVGAGSHNVTLDKIKLLIESGADANAKNKSGETPLDLAKARPDDAGPEIVVYLTELTK